MIFDGVLRGVGRISWFKDNIEYRLGFWERLGKMSCYLSWGFGLVVFAGFVCDFRFSGFFFECGDGSVFGFSSFVFFFSGFRRFGGSAVVFVFIF